jgi:hypothetical protein
MQDSDMRKGLKLDEMRYGEAESTSVAQWQQLQTQSVSLRYCYHRHLLLFQNKNKIRGLSPRANYTDRATAACHRT